jgi:hypothetical protein
MKMEVISTYKTFYLYQPLHNIPEDTSPLRKFMFRLNKRSRANQKVRYCSYEQNCAMYTFKENGVMQCWSLKTFLEG